MNEVNNLRQSLGDSSTAESPIVITQDDRCLLLLLLLLLLVLARMKNEEARLV